MLGSVLQDKLHNFRLCNAEQKSTSFAKRVHETFLGEEKVAVLYKDRNLEHFVLF